MEGKKTIMKIQKYQLWLAFFFFIFGITFAMIIWTVKSAVNTPVYEDRSFMTSYQDVDENYNQMLISNAKFNSKYNTEVNINGRKVGMELSDLRYGQRSLEKKSTNQNMLVVGENKISLSIVDKNKKPITDAKVEFQITRPIEDMYDINLDSFTVENDIYITNANIERAGNWNIIGKITIGDDIGYLYIKTNTQK
jgi:hypothetical protein